MASAGSGAHDNGPVNGAVDIDAAYLDLAFRLMDRLHCGPLLSNFRVFSIITFTQPKADTTLSPSPPLYYSAAPPTALQHPHTSPEPADFSLAGVVPQRHPQLSHADDGLPVYFLTGTNTESCWLGGSVCAERSALTQLRQVAYGRVLAVYLVSQLSTPLAPGLMCREMLLQFLEPDTRIVMAARPPDTEGRLMKVTSMRQLYPHPPLQLHVSSPHLVEFAQQLAFKRPDPALSSLPPAIKSIVVRLLSSTALNSVSTVAASSHYPLRFSASAFVLSNDDTPPSSTVSAGSSYLDEWSHSLDPLTACLPLLSAWKVNRPDSLLLVQHDQCGVLHAPFAAARAHLTQRGYGNAWCVFHERREGALDSDELQLICVRISDLVVDGGDLTGVNLCTG